MRWSLSVLFSVLIIALLVCLVLTKKSNKAIRNRVAFLLAGVTLPVLGNLIIILATTRLPANIGYYTYFIGMDIAVYSVWYFTYAYCDFGKPKLAIKMLIHSLIAIDLIQYMTNPFLKLSFSTEMILVDNRIYFRLVPHIGQAYHRIVCYGIFLAILIVFLVKGIKTERIYAERYWIMFLAGAITGAVESYYIFSRKPVDMSMIGFGLYGLLVFFFALHYRPMKLLDRMLAGFASKTSEALFFFGKDGKCVWINEPGRKLIGVSQNDYDSVNENLTFLFGDIDFKSTGWVKKITLGTGDEAMYTYLTMNSLVDEKGNITGSCLSVRDITEDQREMKREIYNSTHDSITGLYTREYLFEQIEKRLREDKDTHYMIGYMEISNLKVINDVFGRDFAELTLKRAAEFIKEGVGNKCLYGRLSDDSFGILIDKADFDNKPVDEKIANFTVSDNNLEHRVLLHYGIYDISKDDEIDVPLFFDSARLATTMISDTYQERVVYYDDKLRNEIIHNQLISNQLQEAISTRQIKPYLQPIVDERGLLAGAEALVRWLHPEEGFMNPGAFIPVFERNGLIADVDRHMWRCACEILADWKTRGIDCFISINISPKDFYYMDVVKELKNLVEEFCIEPEKLRVEITETVMVNDSIDIIKIVNELRDNGFIVEMDDFGSGYSSLNLLKDINIDVVKIDMQFLKDSERNRKAGTIIKNIINMTKEMDMDSLTEGVETAKQYEYLYAMGCKLYQGYYFSKPIPVEDFENQWFD
ncbi:MAG: EAL domain-containing protein [Paludibacteraceae bacterium]|nr:EAL domain-containing protein [Paludibacteraceae bacterium]